MNTPRHLCSLILVTAVALAGCSSNTPSTSSGGTSGGGTSGGGTSGAPAASLAGSYSGTFEGDSSGPLTMTITGDKIDVVATVSGKPYPASGNVGSNGAVSLGVGVGDGVTVTFSGTFANGAGSGTWSSSIATNGTWSVKK
jgi:hypothetical protein